MLSDNRINIEQTQRNLTTFDEQNIVQKSNQFIISAKQSQTIPSLILSWESWQWNKGSSG